MKISGIDCVHVVTKAADECDSWSLTQYVLFLCSRWTQRRLWGKWKYFCFTKCHISWWCCTNSQHDWAESTNINPVWVILTMWYPISHRCRKRSLTDWVSGDRAGCHTSLSVISSLPQLLWWPPPAPVQHSKAEGKKAMHGLEASTPPYCRNQVTGYRHRHKQRHYFAQKGCDCCKRLLLPPPDWWEKEGLCPTHSDWRGAGGGGEGCLLNI